MKNIHMEVFDSKNTMITQTIDYLKSTKQYIKWAKELSLKEKVYKVVIYKNNTWNEYTKGKLVSWSYPNGI